MEVDVNIEMLSMMPPLQLIISDQLSLFARTLKYISVACSTPELARSILGHTITLEQTILRRNVLCTLHGSANTPPPTNEHEKRTPCEGVEGPSLRPATSSSLLTAQAIVPKRVTVPHHYYGQRLLTQHLLDQREREAGIKPTSIMFTKRDDDGVGSPRSYGVCPTNHRAVRFIFEPSTVRWYVRSAPSSENPACNAYFVNTAHGCTCFGRYMRFS